MHALPSVLAIITFTLWSCCDALIKIASGYGAPPSLPMIYLGYGLAFCLLVKVAVRRKSFKSLWPKKPRVVFLRSAISMVATFSFITAYMKLALSEAYVVGFIAPFCITLGASFFLKEELSLKKVIVVLVGFLGCVIAVIPELIEAQSDGQRDIVIGYIAAFSGALSFSAVQLFSRKLVKSESPESILFNAGAIVGTAGTCIFIFTPATVQFEAYIYLAPVILFNVIAAFSLLYAHKIGSAANVSLFHYWELVMGAMFGYVIWGTLPTIHLIVGAIIIVLSGIYMMSLDRKERQLQRALGDSPI